MGRVDAGMDSMPVEVECLPTDPVPPLGSRWDDACDVNETSFRDGVANDDDVGVIDGPIDTPCSVRSYKTSS